MFKDENQPFVRTNEFYNVENESQRAKVRFHEPIILLEKEYH